MNTKPTLKQLTQDWEEFADSIINAVTIDRNETPAQRKKRMAKLEAEPEEWFKYYFSEECGDTPPAAFHVAATKRIMQHMEWTEVREWARELAKSTRSMMEILYLCMTGKKKFVLLISNSLENATELLMPFKIHLEVNPRIIQDYGTQEKPGKWKDGKFTSRMGFAFRAIGAGQSPRGLKNKTIRPDVILVDDIDTDEDCRNPETIKNKWKWIEDAAIATRSVSKDTLIIFNGNKIAPDCCVVRAEKIADHVSVVNIRDKNGKSTWPTKNSEARIDRILQQKSYFSAQKEYFNNPIIEGSVFPEMYYRKVRPLHEYSMLVCYTDPTYKATSKSDYKATVLVGLWQGEFHVIKAYVEQATTAKMVAWHYDLMELVGNCACYYYMEEVFLQDILLKEFYEAGKEKGKVIPITGDKRAKPEKFTRIESLLEPLNRNGKLFLNEAEKNNPHMQRLCDQFIALAPKSRAHDDAPDAVEGAVYIINNRIVSASSGGVHTIKRNHSHSNKRF